MQKDIKKRIIIVSRVSSGGAYIFCMKFISLFLNFSHKRYDIIYIGPFLDEKLRPRVKHIQTLNIKIPLLNEMLFFLYFPIILLRNFGFKKYVVIAHCRVLPLIGFKIWSVYHSLHFQQLNLHFKNLFIKIVYFLYHFFYSILDIIDIVFSKKNLFINPINNKLGLIPNNFYLPNFIETDLFIPNKMYNNTSYFHVLFIGRNDYAKGLVEAISLITLNKKIIEKKIGKPIFITVISSSIPKGIGVDQHIPFVENNKLPNFINEADIIVNPSLHENVSTILLEAMSCQKIVLTRNVGYIPKIIPFPEYQTYFDDRDFLEKLTIISNLSGEISNLISKSNRTMVENFFGSKVIYNFFSQYENQI